MLEMDATYSRILIITVAVTLVVVLAFYVVFHIFQAIGMTKIAKRYGVAAPWLAWIPMVNAYTLGAICDAIKNKQGKKTYWGIINLAASILSSLVSAVFTIIMVRMLGDILPSLTYNTASNPLFMSRTLTERFSEPSFMILNLLSSVLGTGALVAMLIILYTIFKEYNPESAVLKTVLSCFFSYIIVPFFLFALRNKKTAAELYTGYGNPQAPGYPYNNQYGNQYNNQYGGQYTNQYNGQTNNTWNGSGSVLDSGTDVFGGTPNPPDGEKKD